MSRFKNTNHITNSIRTALIAVFCVFSFAAVIMPTQVSAQASKTDVVDCKANQNVRLLGLIPKWYKYLPYEHVNGGASCDIRLDLQNSPGGILPIGLAIIEILLSIAGVVAVVFVMIGGLRYVTSQGEPDGTKSARQTVINALIGGGIAIIATSLVNFLGKRFTS